jgi:ABC transporter transmembrane region
LKDKEQKMHQASVGYRSSRHVVQFPQIGFLILLTAHIVLPFASPFAVGIYASTSTVPSSKWKNGLRSVLGTIPDRISSRGGGRGNWNKQQSQRNSTIDDWKLGESSSTIFSKLLFGYVTSLVDLASKRELNDSDVFHVPVSQTMGSAVPEFTNSYQIFRNKARLNHSPSKRRTKPPVSSSESSTLCQALLWHQRRTLLVTGILRLVNTGIQAFPAILIARLLHLLETGKTISIHQSFLAATSLLLVLTLKMIIENQYFHRVVTCATQVRGSLAGMIFEKSLRLPSGALEGGGSLGNPQGEPSDSSSSSWSDGRVLNLMQSDTAVIESTAMQLHTIWDGPLQIIMYTSLLFKYLGPSVLWGIGVLLLVIPMNSLTLRILNQMRRSENEAKDARTKRTSEAISNMKLLKLQGWETNFAQDIQAHRSEELRRHSSRGVVRALNQAISNAVPAVVLVVTLMAYAKSGRPIIASKIFTAISLFNQLRFRK